VAQWLSGSVQPKTWNLRGLRVGHFQWRQRRSTSRDVDVDVDVLRSMILLYCTGLYCRYGPVEGNIGGEDCTGSSRLGNTDTASCLREEGSVGMFASCLSACHPISLNAPLSLSHTHTHIYIYAVPSSQAESTTSYCPAVTPTTWTLTIRPLSTLYCIYLSHSTVYIYLIEPWQRPERRLSRLLRKPQVQVRQQKPPPLVYA
jgi:hypothetical protein